MGAAEKAAVGKVIVSVACSDGTIAPAEIKQLEKIYSSLGWIPHLSRAISISIPQLNMISSRLYQLISQQQGSHWMLMYLPATNLPRMMFVNC